MLVRLGLATLLLASSYQLPPVRVTADRPPPPPTNALHPWDLLCPTISDRLRTAERAETACYHIPVSGSDDFRRLSFGYCITGDALEELKGALLDEDRYVYWNSYEVISHTRWEPMPILVVRFEGPLGPVEIEAMPSWSAFHVIEPERLQLPGMFAPRVLHKLGQGHFPGQAWGPPAVDRFRRAVEAAPN